MADVTPVNGSINLGRQGENIVTRVLLPLSDIRYGDGYAVLFHQRSVDDSPYPVVVEEDGDTLIWTVTDADTAVAGRGKAEMRWIGSHGELAKSQVYKTYVAAALEIPEEVPSGYQKYVDAVVENAKEARKAADEATAALEGAQEGKEAAESARDAAQGAAQTAQNLYNQVKQDLDEGKLKGEKGDKGDKGDVGPMGPTGPKGDPGYTPQKGVDYWTTEEVDAVTADAVGKAEEAANAVVSDLQQELAETKTALETTQKDLAKAQRAIKFQAELNQGQTWDFEEDTQEAYQRQVPSGAHAGAILEVSGKTRRGRNLWDMSAPLTEGNANIVNGHYVAPDGNLLIDCTGDSIGARRVSIPAGDIAISFDSDINGNVFFCVVYQDDSRENFFLQGNRTTITLQKHVTRCGFVIYDSKVGEIFKNVQVELGTTAHPYEPYTPDPVSAEVDEVRVRGRNLLDTTKLRSTVAANGVTYTRNDDGTYNRVGTATTDAGNLWLWGGILLVPNLQSPNWFIILKKGITYYINDIRVYTVIGGKAIGYGEILVPDQDLYITGLRNDSFKTGTTYDDIVYPGIYESQKKVAWSQYHLSTHPIPAAVRNLPGYGWSAGSVANTIERTENGWQYVQRVGSRAYQEGDELTDGTTTYYALESPITTDITELMGDALAPFAVEAGGSITLHHPKADEGYEIDVPAKVQYITKLSEVSANG